MQGDDVEVDDIKGTTVVKYKYDAWGSIIYQFDSGLGVANANPFRYRSYYFDTETGWYYLQSRYYNPSIGRFISADGQTNELLIGENLYSYCYNNSVMYTDIDGRTPKSIIWKGWKIFIHGPHGYGQKHIHVNKGSDKYSQNIDGTPHDGSTGNPTNTVIDLMDKKLGWKWINQFAFLPEKKPFIYAFPILDSLGYIGKIPMIDSSYIIESIPLCPSSVDIEFFPEAPFLGFFESIPKDTLIIVGVILVVLVIIALAPATGGGSLVFLA